MAGLTTVVAVVLLAGAVISSIFAGLANQRAAALVVVNQDLDGANSDLDDKVDELEQSNAQLTSAQTEIRRSNDELGRSNVQLMTTQKELRNSNTDLSSALDDVREKEHLASIRLYAAQISAADRAWNNNDAATAKIQLNRCHWDLRGWEHAYLAAKFHRGHKTFYGHDAAVSSVAFSPDGKRIVSGGGAQIKVWDSDSGTGSGRGREVLTLDKHASGVYSVAFSPDGKQIVSGSTDRTIKVWDATSGHEILTLVEEFELIREIELGRPFIMRRVTVAFSPDGKRLVTGSDRNTVKVWDVANGRELLEFKGHTDDVLSVAFSSDGGWIVSGSHDKSIKVWDAATG